MRAFAIWLLLLLATSAAMGAVPTDFDLRAAYCLGTMLERLPDRPGCLGEKPTPTERQLCIDTKRLEQYVEIAARRYAPDKGIQTATVDGYRDAVRVDAASKQFDLDALFACELRGKPDLQSFEACRDDQLRAFDPLAPAAQHRIDRCAAVIKALPF